MTAQLILYTGGARSGKSRLAQDRLKTLDPVVYIATAQALDAEMRERIALHQKHRPANWTTIEEPLELSDSASRAIQLKPQGILIDCLTLWLSNQLLKRWDAGWNADSETEVLGLLEQALHQLRRADGAHVVIVTNEVGSGIVPTNEMARAYRDLVGHANQLAAQHSNEVHWVAVGLGLRLK